MRDVIEHIYDKTAALRSIFSLLNDDGYLFLAFPLKYSAYAGHNQSSKTWLKYVFFLSLYPVFFIRFLHRLAGDTHRTDVLLYIKKCALSYFRLKKLIRYNWNIHHIDFFISRPVCKQRFGWSVIKIPNIPFLREFANGCELVLQKAHNNSYEM